ncbi:mechanosensitive ion channel domain-containing protein [Desertimonas flava]|uniref:mechanosensitive ion channel domain-containing protein n=1 Tax=Desertimonas flava TaxID=2064846 RepID=UPI0013C4E258|nr:mechanosensitive ion channel domain-containing protein [Desertimonas flava]
MTGWDVALATIAVAFSWIAGRGVRRTVLRLAGRIEGVGEDLRQFVARLAKYLVWVVGVGVALGFLGAQVQPLLAVAAVVAVTGVLALKGIGENFVAGLVIQTRHPFQRGDRIEALGHVGTVVDVNGRTVVLETGDGRTVHLPNAEVLQHPIVNVTATRRQKAEVEVRADARAGLDAVLDALAAALDPLGAGHEQPRITIRSIGTGSFVLHIGVWHDVGDTASETVRAVAAALFDAGIAATVSSPPPAGREVPA